MQEQIRETQDAQAGAPVAGKPEAPSSASGQPSAPVSSSKAQAAQGADSPAKEQKGARARRKPEHKVPLSATTWLRLGIQLVFLVLAPQAFSAAFAGARSIAASVAGGLSIDVAGFVAALAMLCAYTVLFGRFFCGFACSFGLLGDALYYLGTLVLRVFRRPRRMMGEALEGKLRYVKYVVLALVLAGTALGASSFITAVSPWTAFGRMINLQPEQMGIMGTAVLLCVCVLMMVKERAFCEFICPLGAIFALLPQLGSARMRRDMGACTQCATCQRSCPVSIYPPDDGAQMGECLQCDRCLRVCPAECVGCGKTRSSAAARAARAIALAAVLLVLLWLCDCVNFLPSVQDLFFVEEAATSSVALS